MRQRSPGSTAAGAPAPPIAAGEPDDSEPGYAATPIVASDEELAAIRYDADGLVAAVVQDRASSDVLMLAWMDAEALRRTLESGRTWFWSRSRAEYWCKGETSGAGQWVRSARYDCDGDTVLLLVDQEGSGACHTGEHSCFYRAFGAGEDRTAGGAGGA